MSGTGLFISFEGGEAAGKSTQVARLAVALRAAGRTVLELREPGGTPLGEKIRHLLKHDPDGHGMCPEAELLLMNASRAELVRRVVRPALAAGSVVLCDRFLDSTRAYQGHGRRMEAATVEAVLALAVGGTLPDITLYLEVPPEVARARLVARQGGNADRFEAEAEAFFGRVHEGYAALVAAEPGRFVRIAASGTADEVAAAVWAAVAPRLPASADQNWARNRVSFS